MLPNDTRPDPGAQLSDVGEQNVERLLDAAYRPEDPDPQFARTLTARLCATARASAARPASQPQPPDARWRPVRRRLGWAMGLAAAVAVVALALYAAERRAEVPADASADHDGADQPAVRQASLPGDAAPFGLTPRPRPEAPPAQPLAVGASLRTRAGERRRVTLADGSVLYLNQDTRITQTGARRLSLEAGEIYLEVAPREQGATGASFVVATPQRKVSALGTRFAVRAAAQGTGVVVTQGKVRVAGLGQLVLAGQQLAPGSSDIAPAPRASHQLDWTRELMAAAESPLVPCSKHAGGALIAVDPNGQEMRLTLRKYHIDVHIEDGFARTTIDQTYFNNETDRLEGTFYFPLPPDASLSRLAMYVEAGGVGQLMEGGMAEANLARDAYETIRYARRDPALLEWVDGSTFKMRVFPLEGRKEKRLLLSYTQRLDSLYGVARYRFPGGHNMDFVKEWSFAARVKHGAALHCSSPTHPGITFTPKGSDMLLSLTEKNVKPDRDVALEVSGRTPLAESGRFSAFTHEKARYLMVRYQPPLAGAPKRARRDWVFLFESAANRDPLLARAQIEIIRGLLKNAEHDDTFTILTAGTRPRLFDRQPRPNTPSNAAEAVKFLEGTHLIGALDLERAFKEAAPLLKAGKNPHLVHVGAGVPAMGETAANALVKLLPDGVRYVGIGVGKRWNRALMKLAAERTGGYFTQVNPDEPLAWRAFELLATLNTPRLLELRVVDNAERVTFLCDAVSLTQGEEVCAIARIEGKDAALPQMLTVSGKLDGKPFVRVLAVKGVAEGAGYLPRTWAKREIDRLLAEDGAKHRTQIIALSKAMYVMSPYTSLLVLETEADYARFKVDRGRKDHWAMYPAPAKVPLVYEPLWPAAAPNPAQAGKRPTPEQVLQSILVRMPPRPGGTTIYAVDGLWLYRGAYAQVDPRVLSRLGEMDEMGLIEYERFPGSERLVRDRIQLLRESEDRRVLRWELLDEASKRVSSRRLLDWRQRRGDIRLSTEINFEYAPRMKSLPRLSPYLNLLRESSPVFGYYRTLPGKATETNRPELLIDRLVTTEYERAMLGTDTAEYLAALANITEVQALLDRLEDLKRQGKTVVSAEDYSAAVLTRDKHREEALSSRATLTMTYTQTIKFYDPALGLNVRGTARVHNKLMGDLITSKAEANMPMLRQMHSRSPLFVLASDLDDAELAREAYFRQRRASQPPSLLYQRPTFTHDPQMFGDLVHYAPALNTTEADIAAVLESEAAPAPGSPSGTIDPAARALIEKARAGGWQAATFPGKGKRPAARLLFNAAGQFFLDHTLESGLREVIVCDGATLLHLYPELGLGARRTLSRGYRAELLALLPWLLPPAEELAHGADVKRLDEHTIAVSPRGAASQRDTKGKVRPYFELRLDFTAAGPLAERCLMLMPEGKALSRETYTGGVLKLYAGNDAKPVVEHTTLLTTASAPDLKPNTAKLVVVPMPLRTRAAIMARPSVVKANGLFADWQADDAIALIAAECARGDGAAALQVFRDRFHTKGDRRVGFYTLMTSSGFALDPLHNYPHGNGHVRFDVVLENPGNPLALYLAYHSATVRQGLRSPLGPIGGPATGFVQRLAAVRDMGHRWVSGESRKDTLDQTRAEVAKAIAFAKDIPPAYAWELLNTVHAGLGTADHAVLLTLSDATRTVGAKVGMGYTTRYEYARLLRNADRRDEARAEFRKLHADALAAGLLPPIDSDFRDTLLGAPKGEVGWAELMRTAANRLAKGHNAAGVLALAEQAAQLGAAALAEELCDVAVGSASDAERPLVTLAAVHFLTAHGEHARAAAHLEPLLKDKRFARSPALWHLAADLAMRRKLPGRAVVCLEKALELEYRELPEVVNLEQVRADYGRLLGQYREVANALTILETEPARDFVAKVVRAADRWRSLDPDGTAACQAAGAILRTLGEKDLAWDYLTTPVGQKPGESGPWASLAQVLRNDGDFDLADRAYATAFAAEQTNAQILWDRAQNLQGAGRADEARRLFRQLAEGTWQERFAGLQQQARSYLGGR